LTYLGIDPGLSGGLALVNGAGILQVKRMTELRRQDRENPKLSGALLAKWLISQRLAMQTLEPQPILAFIEWVHGFPGESVTSAFTFGSTFGITIGVLEALQFPLAFVSPMTWKRDLGLLKQPKDASRQLAIKTWPASAGLFTRKLDGDVAEAALIAEWARTRPA
jgi:crossover junction endodeoxyribonuclease RuvC